MKVTSEAKLLAAMGAVVLLGGGFLMLNSGGFPLPGSGGPRPTPAPTPTPRAVSLEEFNKIFKGATHVKGDVNARYTIVEFADFQCPTCRRGYSYLTNKFGTEIPVRFAFRHFPLEDMHPFAIPAALGVEAAQEQDKFWDMYEALFKEPKPLWSDTYVRGIADQVGLDLKKFDAFVANPSNTAAITKARDEAAALGVNSTPTFWILDNQTKTVKVAVAMEVFKALEGIPGVPAPPKPNAPSNP